MMVSHDSKATKLSTNPTTFSPFVLWGQDNESLFLSIELQSVLDPDIRLDEKSIRFQSNGIGQHGNSNYKFELDFYDTIDPDQSTFKVNENCVEFSIKKIKKVIWPRMTLNKMRLAWLKVNFQKSQFDDTDDESNIDKIKNEQLEYYNEKFGLDSTNKSDLDKERELIELMNRPITNVEFSRKIYLMLYNLTQLYGTVYILMTLILRFSTEESTTIFTVTRDLQSTVAFLSYLKTFEILHQVFTFVFDKDRTVWYHCLNRIFMFCVLIEYEPRMVTKPATYYLVLIYAIFDLVNYTYYIIRVLEIDLRFLRWLRCTIWIPLYPLIFLLEAIILLRSIPYYDETQRFNLELPNRLNFSFPFLIFLRTYLFIFFTPIMYFTMNNFYKHRSKTLNPDPKKNGKKKA